MRSRLVLSPLRFHASRLASRLVGFLISFEKVFCLCNGNVESFNSATDVRLEVQILKKKSNFTQDVSIYFLQTLVAKFSITA